MRSYKADREFMEDRQDLSNTEAPGNVEKGGGMMTEYEQATGEGEKTVYRGPRFQPLVVKFCPVCKKPFEVPIGRANRTIYCSTSCAQRKYSNRINLSKPLIREYYLERCNFKCSSCSSTAELVGQALELHHIFPLSNGGTDDPENIQVLCFKCHREKHGIISDVAPVVNKIKSMVAGDDL